MVSASQRSLLDGSWHVLDDDPHPSDGSSSAADEQPLPNVANVPPPRYATRSRSPERQHVVAASAPRRRSSARHNAAPQSTTEKLAGPELIMPKITTPTASPSKKATRLKDKNRTKPSQTAKTDRDEAASRKAVAASCRSLAASIWSSVVAPPLGFMTGLLSDTLFFIRPFLGMALAMSIFAMLVWITAASAYARIWRATGLAGKVVEPMAVASCSLPVFSLAPWCRPEKLAKVSQVAFNNLVEVQDKTFGKLLHLADSGLELPLIMINGEVPVMELRDLILYQSQLRSKEELAQHMDNYVEISRRITFDLPRLIVQVGYAVDSIISMNRLTLRFLEVVRREPDSGFLSRLLPGASSRRHTFSDVIAQYLLHANKVEQEIDELILEANPWGATSTK